MATRDPFKADVREYYRTASHALITTPDAQHKYALSGEGVGAVYQCGLNLSPARESRKWNLCAGSSCGCRAVCLIFAGQNQWPSSAVARVMRTRFLMEERPLFLAKLDRELDGARAKATKLGMRFAFRFNTLSDVDVVALCGHLIKPGDLWLDYTKVQAKYRAWLARATPGYHLTFSRSENNEAFCLEMLALGGTVTLVVRDEGSKARVIARGHLGFPGVDGDLSDRRWEDPRGHWVVLIAKGKARKDVSGFVVDRFER